MDKNKTEKKLKKLELEFEKIRELCDIRDALGNRKHANKLEYICQRIAFVL